jgi:hypothetical protein
MRIQINDRVRLFKRIPNILQGCTSPQHAAVRALEAKVTHYLRAM